MQAVLHGTHVAFADQNGFPPGAVCLAAMQCGTSTTQAGQYRNGWRAGVRVPLPRAGAAPLASKARCEEMMRMMRNQRSGDRRLPHYLEVPVAHKTGDWPPYLANDVGVIFAKSGPIVIVVCTNDIRGTYGEAEDRIGEVARTVVAYFDGQGI